MDKEALKTKVRSIVEKVTSLKNKHTDNTNAPINYACIFAQSEKEYDALLKTTKQIGTIIKETPTGPLFHIEPLETISGILRLLKIRIPDVTRPECGDADFTVSHFSNFEKRYLDKAGFTLIKRENFVMVELMDADFDVRAYFSNPPLDIQLNLKDA